MLMDMGFTVRNLVRSPRELESVEEPTRHPTRRIPDAVVDQIQLSEEVDNEHHNDGNLTEKSHK